ncbi:hypothetical protein N0V84_005488 [Fusarium piperis]|uniref:Uncharacterized protein n=1 Tax=Fusarium piperis TaxID=1435070 RepID=A0A9W8WDN5_9HYPO|nr:hypothetical protein N0V84_005488 [Fusarium piperis]
MEDLLGMLHCDRFGVRGWEEAYPGEVDDIFAAKIHLLSTYKAITKQEESLLELVLKAMRDITDLQKKGSLSGLDLQKASWETLWLAVSPFYERCEIGLFDLESKTGREFHVKKRLHRFAFKSSQPYNPWRAWFTQAKLQKRWEAWEPRSARAMELALWNDEEWKSIWRILRWNEAINVDEEGNAKVRWCQMGLDVWVDTVKRDYLRRSLTLI